MQNGPDSAELKCLYIVVAIRIEKCKFRLLGNILMSFISGSHKLVYILVHKYNKTE